MTKPETEKLPELPWRPVNERPECDDLFWFMRGDTIDGPRAPSYDDVDYWDWFAPCEAPPTRTDRSCAVELTVCCGREECGGECGNPWRGTQWYRKTTPNSSALRAQGGGATPDAAPTGPHFVNDGTTEAQFIADAEIACPHCGGSGHRDDVKTPDAAPEVTDSMVERAMDAQTAYWEDGMWNCNRCAGKGYHHGFGEDGSDPDWCGGCGGSGSLNDGTDEGAMRAALNAAIAHARSAGGGG